MNELKVKKPWPQKHFRGELNAQETEPMLHLRSSQSDLLCQCRERGERAQHVSKLSPSTQPNRRTAIPATALVTAFSKRFTSTGVITVWGLLVVGLVTYGTRVDAQVPRTNSVADREVEFNREIRPILSETCFRCHGPDEHARQADLRLDTFEGATADLGGYQPIVPGNDNQSEAWQRIISQDPDQLMPPPESHLALSDEQKNLLLRWIKQGAKYEGHWAFIPPVAPVIPEVNVTDAGSSTKWAQGAIDSLVAARFIEAGLIPKREANARTLIRRLTFDLTGLPPTLDQTHDFVTDYQTRGEVAYQAAITRLLASPHFGERMAVPWMDAARYADTNGYSIDGGRDLWLWRDWVIQAYNDDMPFDQFLTEQLAGDLLPDASESQQIATGFNRNHMITHEGGTIPAENLTNYVADRVKTTAEVFLGLTMGCAQCHDHKYDPISQKEYYEFFAFFNELDDRGLDGDAGVNSAPAIMASTVLKTEEAEPVEIELAELRQQLASHTDGLDAWLDLQRSNEKHRGDAFEFLPIKLLSASAPNSPGPLEFEEDGNVRLASPNGGLNGISHSMHLLADSKTTSTSVDGVRVEFHPQETGESQALALTPFGDGVPKVTAVLISATSQPADQVDYHRQLGFSLATASSSGAGHEASNVMDERNDQWWQPAVGDSPQQLTLTFDQPVDLIETPYLSVLIVFGRGQSLPFYWRVRPFSGRDSDSRWDAELSRAFGEAESTWTESTRQHVLDAFRRKSSALEPLRIRIENLQERLEVLRGKHSTMVMNAAAQPRETFVLSRGQYDAPTDRVFAKTPRVLPALRAAADTTANRLDLAKWMTNPQHPLTARVAVNRIWALFFGTGIVATSADFGSQGEFPSHPKLLDYLATRFIENGWSQKELIREIVSSATYRQDSSATPEQLAVDPRNRRLASGPRFRLPAEFIRDQALAVSGLLVPRVGGPSVNPYQPPSLWKEVSHFGSTPATRQVFVQDQGENLYRRSLYTIVKRTSPHPAMSAFDAPNREMCTVDRGITNTPLQALVTLNDPQFAESARVWAQSILQNETLTNDNARLRNAFERIVCREPNENEAAALMKLLNSEREIFNASPGDAKLAVSVGQSPTAAELDPVELAAWMQVTTLLINLSESLTRS